MGTTDVQYQHWLSHAFLAPRRWYCSFFWNRCVHETYNNDEGIADYLYGSYKLVTSFGEMMPSLLTATPSWMKSFIPFLGYTLQRCMIVMSLFWYTLDVIFVNFSSIFFFLSSMAAFIYITTKITIK